MYPNHTPAPELITSEWLNSSTSVSLKSLRGKVIFLYCFQMLCPACVSHGLPQALRAASTFPKQDVVVIGLHTVFEHHQSMNKTALQAFLHEYRVTFPVGIDMPQQASAVPLSMQQLGLRGTPSLLLDRDGKVRLHHFGIIDDMKLGHIIGQLVTEKTANGTGTSTIKDEQNFANSKSETSTTCSDLSCQLN